MMRFPIARALPVLLAAHFACGGNETPDPEEIASMSEDEVAEMARDVRDLSDVRACELLTAEEIEAAVGIAPAAPQDMTQVQGQLPMCNWTAAGGGMRSIAAILVTRGGFSDFDEFMEVTSGEWGPDFDPADFEHVQDVGDFGVWLDEAGMLQVFDDGLMVQVSVDPAEGTDRLAAAKDLANTAFGRL